MFCTLRSIRCLSVAALLDSSLLIVSRLFCMAHFRRDVLPWWSNAFIISGVRSFRFRMNFGWTVGQCWNNRWGIVCLVSLIVSELKCTVFFEFLFVRYSSMMPLCPLIIANISGERPEVVDKARSFRPWKKEIRWFPASSAILAYIRVATEQFEKLNVSCPTCYVKESASWLIPPVDVFIPEDSAGVWLGTGLQELHELSWELWPVLIPRTTEKHSISKPFKKFLAIIILSNHITC